MRAPLIAALLAAVPLAAQAETPPACAEAAAQHEAGRYEAALAGYDACLRVIEGDADAMADAYHRRGRAHMKLGDLDAAMVDYDLAIAVAPGHAGAWNSRAWVRYLQGEHEAALADVEQALVLEPQSVRALDTRAHILAALQRTGEAMAAFEQAMALHGDRGIAKTQEHLRAAGYDPGPIDGIYEPRTRQALAACVADACNLWN
jgi:tetratricopeptide (TPR) repeat protein